ncbi:cytochrome P450 [Tengunoibacter tsumagoiensis]|uniref:Cytochrome P450 n=1 Tax=Tengunoibacter tsumagoiensis TaxID=2014871 RepID=A0A401ZVE4_9CHLR|nr:cytochrome P450 [Tengunoibacter tsumagoiensis]GCE10863.1 cytochrome P450 [Tengunoibacter tsumagoiensis]
MANIVDVPVAQEKMTTLKSLDSLRDLQKSPLLFFSNLTQRYGDIVQIRIFFWPVIIINHPDYIKQVLQGNYRNYNKDVPIFNLFKPLLGNGLVTTYGGESWLQQRRLMQPAFHRQRLSDLGHQTTSSIETMFQHWERYALKHEPLDVAEEMMHLTLNIVSQALFSIDIHERANLFGEAFLEINAFLLEYFNRPFPPLNFPTPRNRRFHRALKTLNTVVYDIMKQHQQAPERHQDLLSMLIEARDEETGEGMSNQQLRDEVMTLLVAGHETAANGLAWSWYLLAEHPEVEQKLHEELDRVLAGRIPTIEDLPNLPYTRMVFEETMRLYPPVWIIMRKALDEDELGEHKIPKQTYVLWSTYAMHRHPEFWERPEQFYPEHFLPEQVAKRPRHAYIPFSHGPRICIGNNFAMVESQLILAMVAQRYRLKLVPDQKIEPQPLMTLRPKYGIQVYIEPR